MKINFNNLKINDIQLEIMFNRIKEKDKVTELNLSYNDFTKLPDSISGFTNLKWLRLYNCFNLISLGKIKEFSGNLNLYKCSNLKSLGELEKVSEYLNLGNCSSFKNLGNLKEVGGNLYLTGSINLKDLGNLEKVGGKIHLWHSGITEKYIKEFKPLVT